MPKLYRIWKGYTDGNEDGERHEIARLKSFNLSDTINYIKNIILKNSVDFYTDLNFAHFYLILDSCKNCDLKKTDEDICDDCEYTEFIEIDHDDTVKESLRVNGENAFYDLTLNHNESVDEALVSLTISKIKGKMKVIQ